MLSSDVKDFVIVTNVPENGARFPYLPVHSDNWLRRYAWLSSSLPTAVETPTPGSSSVITENLFIYLVKEYMDTSHLLMSVVGAKTVTTCVYNHFLWNKTTLFSSPLGLLLIIDDDRPWAHPDLVRSTWLMGQVELSDGYILISTVRANISMISWRLQAALILSVSDGCQLFHWFWQPPAGSQNIYFKNEAWTFPQLSMVTT